MQNNQHTQSTQKTLPRRSHPATIQQPRSGVGQDNPTPPPARAATTQPAPPKNAMRPTRKETNTARTQQGKAKKRKTVHLTLWVRPVVKAELERIAQAEGLSVSSVGAAFLEKAVQADIHTQHGALLETIIDKAIGKHMRAYSNRLAALLVRSLFASEQTRSFVINILGRQEGVTQPMLETILNGSSNTARANITRITPQLKTLIEAVQKQLAEEVNASG